jgi:hypothetical protein
LRPTSFVRSLLSVLFVASATALGVGAQATPPTGMAAVENARSTDCVGKMAAVADLNAKAAPYVRRVQRIQALARAVALEDTSDVAPMDTLDALERDVRDWFQRDDSLALKIVAGDSALVARRDQEREAIKKRLQDEMSSVTTEAQGKLAGADSVQSEALPCQNAIFVRPAVLEACKTTASSPLCGPAALPPDSAAKVSPFKYVNKAEDLWDVEEMRPWTDPVPLQQAPDGSMVVPRTAARSRHGNIIVAVALAPMIRSRAQLDSAQIAEFESNLDSLGYTFDHPDFVMAPAIEIQASLPAPVGNENLYLLHFGDVANPDVIWSMKAGDGGVIQASFPATPKLLDRLKAGDQLSFTAVDVPEGSAQGTPVYSVTLLNLNQVKATTTILGYMESGDLAKDLKALVPPKGGAG